MASGSRRNCSRDRHWDSGDARRDACHSRHHLGAGRHATGAGENAINRGEDVPSRTPASRLMRRIVKWYWDQGGSWGELLASTILFALVPVLCFVRGLNEPSDSLTWLLGALGLPGRGAGFTCADHHRTQRARHQACSELLAVGGYDLSHTAVPARQLDQSERPDRRTLLGVPEAPKTRSPRDRGVGLR
jgi:hypothetical protein